MHGLPTIGTIGFGWFDVSGRSRVPSPPAMTTAFTSRTSRRAFQRYAASAASASAEADPEDDARPQRSLVRDHREAERRVQQPGRDLAQQVHLERVAAVHGRLVPDEQQKVTERDEERHPGKPARVPEQDDGRVDQQPVGERVGDLPEGRLDAPAPREEAVDLVRHRGGAEDDRRRPAPASVRGEEEHREDRE